MIESLLLQVLLVMFGVIVYQVFYHRIKGKNGEFYGAGIFGLAVVLCMSFPLSFEVGSIMDLRTTPWLLAFLYGGKRVGMLVTVVMLGYRLIIGGQGVYVVLFAYGLTFLLLKPLAAGYLEFGYSKKLIKSNLIVLANSLLVLTFFYVFFPLPLVWETWHFYISFVATNAMAISLAVYLMELLRENERLKMNAERAEKLRLTSQLAASVAHEIRNPLTGIGGMIQLLAKSSEISGKNRTYVEASMAEVSRINGIISEFLGLARPSSHPSELKKVSVSDQIGSACAIMQGYAAQREIGLEFPQVSTSLYALSDAQRFRQVLLNLIKNAIEASNHGTLVRVNGYRQNGYIHVEISDAGQGMTEEQIKHLGTPFSTTKHEGNGLGMMVCYNIIQSLDGELLVNSQPGAGTCFTVKVPEERS